MEEKRQDLRAEKQKTLINRLVSELSAKHPDFYYLSTMDVAYAIKDYVKTDAKLTQDDRVLIDPLTPKDIQMILSLR